MDEIERQIISHDLGNKKIIEPFFGKLIKRWKEKETKTQKKEGFSNLRIYKKLLFYYFYIINCIFVQKRNNAQTDIEIPKLSSRVK